MSQESAPLILSPARCAGRNGLYAGAVMALTSLTWVLAPRVAGLGLLTLLGLAWVPVMVYRMMARDCRQSRNYWTMGTVWLDGLLTILGGGVIATAVLLVYLRWVEPDFLANQWEAGLALLSEMPDPQIQAFVADSRRAMANGFAVTPVMFSMTVLWIISFTGSLLTLVMAVVVKLSNRDKLPPVNQYD